MSLRIGVEDVNLEQSTSSMATTRTETHELTYSVSRNLSCHLSLLPNSQFLSLDSDLL